MKAYIITDNDEYILGYALASSAGEAKSFALQHHPDPSSAEYTSMVARRLPCLDDHEIFLLNNTWYIDMCEPGYLHPSVMSTLKKLGLAWRAIDEYGAERDWEFAFKKDQKVDLGQDPTPQSVI